MQTLDGLNSVNFFSCKQVICTPEFAEKKLCAGIKLLRSLIAQAFGVFMSASEQEVIWSFHGSVAKVVCVWRNDMIAFH